MDSILEQASRRFRNSKGCFFQPFISPVIYALNEIKRKEHVNTNVQSTKPSAHCEEQVQQLLASFPLHATDTQEILLGFSFQDGNTSCFRVKTIRFPFFFSIFPTQPCDLDVVSWKIFLRECSLLTNKLSQTVWKRQFLRTNKLLSWFSLILSEFDLKQVHRVHSSLAEWKKTQFILACISGPRRSHLGKWEQINSMFQNLFSESQHVNELYRSTNKMEAQNILFMVPSCTI